MEDLVDIGSAWMAGTVGVFVPGHGEAGGYVLEFDDERPSLTVDAEKVAELVRRYEAGELGFDEATDASIARVRRMSMAEIKEELRGIGAKPKSGARKAALAAQLEVALALCAAGDAAIESGRGGWQAGLLARLGLAGFVAAQGRAAR